MSEMDDAGLLGRARMGDETAFSQLFARFQRQVFRYASYMGGQDAADDIVQETFLTVLRQKDRRDAPTGSLAGYLIGIARHLLMKRQASPAAWTTEEITPELAVDPGPSAFDRLATTQSVETVRAAVRSLPPVYREALVLCELQDVDYTVAASLMQCPVGTIRSRVHRARSLVAAKLEVMTRVEVDAGGSR